MQVPLPAPGTPLPLQPKGGGPHDGGSMASLCPLTPDTTTGPFPTGTERRFLTLEAAHPGQGEKLRHSCQMGGKHDPYTRARRLGDPNDGRMGADHPPLLFPGVLAHSGVGGGGDHLLSSLCGSKVWIHILLV